MGMAWVISDLDVAVSGCWIFFTFCFFGISVICSLLEHSGWNALFPPLFSWYFAHLDSSLLSGGFPQSPLWDCPPLPSDIYSLEFLKSWASFPLILYSLQKWPSPFEWPQLSSCTNVSLMWLKSRFLLFSPELYFQWCISSLRFAVLKLPPLPHVKSLSSLSIWHLSLFLFSMNRKAVTSICTG